MITASVLKGLNYKNVREVEPEKDLFFRIFLAKILKYLFSHHVYVLREL